MTTWFADSFFFFALLDEDDEAHERAVNIVRSLKANLLTTPWVLTELADGLAAPPRRMEVVAFVEFLRSHPRVTILPLEELLFQEGLELYSHRQDKDWTLTDCISFAAMARHHITEALTGDHHFEQAGFKALLH